MKFQDFSLNFLAGILGGLVAGVFFFVYNLAQAKSIWYLIITSVGVVAILYVLLNLIIYFLIFKKRDIKDTKKILRIFFSTLMYAFIIFLLYKLKVRGIGFYSISFLLAILFVLWNIGKIKKKLKMRKLKEKGWAIGAIIIFIVFFCLFIWVTVRPPLPGPIDNKIIYYNGTLENFDIFEVYYEYKCKLLDKLDGKYLTTSSMINCNFICNASDKFIPKLDIKLVSPNGEEKVLFNKGDDVSCIFPNGHQKSKVFGEAGTFILIIEIHFDKKMGSNYGPHTGIYHLEVYKNKDYIEALGRRDIISLAFLSLSFTVFVGVKYFRDLWKNYH